MSVLEQNSRRKLMLGQDGNALFYLLALNAVLFVILYFIYVVYLLTDGNAFEFKTQVFDWFAVPSDPGVFITRPWTLLVYMFAQRDFWLLFANLLWLWSFGYILQDLTGNKKIIPLYLYGGFAGSIFFLLTVNLLPALKSGVVDQSYLSGAGPAIMAIAVAATTLAPRYKIFPFIGGGIPLWILTAIFVFITIFTANGIRNPGHVMAHVGGGLTGFLFMWQMTKGNDWSTWMNNLVTWLDDLFNPEKKQKKISDKKRLYYKSETKPFVKTPHITQQRIDELLDKINHKGYNSLTEEEKEFLKKASSEDF